MNGRLLFALVAAFLAVGCKQTQFIGRPGLNTVRQAALPAPEREDVTIPARPYALGPGDQLNIDVFGAPELSVREVTVDLSGRVAVPLIGSLVVSGKTTSELASEVQSKLRASYMRDPVVTVNIASAASQSFTVDGSVGQPGIYPIVGRMSLMRAIARAQGTGEFAREDYVVVFRRAQGKDYAALYDLRAIRQGIYADPEIFSNDVIFVGDSQARRLFKDVLSTTAVLAVPLITLVR